MAASTAELHVPVEQVTLDARLVAETIAGIWEASARIMAFNGGDATATSDRLDVLGEDLYRACFPIVSDESGATVGLWAELVELAEARAKGETDAR